jgi:hypothetical protein
MKEQRIGTCQPQNDETGRCCDGSVVSVGVMDSHTTAGTPSIIVDYISYQDWSVHQHPNGNLIVCCGRRKPLLVAI